MQYPVTASWGLSISDTDFDKLKKGFESKDPDEKWRISATSQGHAGDLCIHLSRSGGGKEYYTLDVKPSEAFRSTNGARIESITWEQNKSGIRIMEEQAKKEVVILTRRLLGCDFHTLPQYDVADLWKLPAVRS